MTEGTTPDQRDLLASAQTRLLFWLPWLLILIGGFIGGVTRTVLWTVGFSVAGAACLVNARRCGRRHCFYTGPLYLLAALASLLYGLHVLPLGEHGWNWIAGIAVVGSLFFCYGLEKLLGKYTRAQ
ncbi:MAG: hypothetical protein ACRESX_06150 [Gammaproteobacteria bacterium]